MGILQLRKWGTLHWYEVVQDLSEIPTVEDPGSPSHDKNFSTALKIMKQIRNQITKLDPTTFHSWDQLLVHAENGGGMLCGGLALLYFYELREANVPSRLLFLRTSLFRTSDSHVSVEIWTPKGWILMDPTFGTSFEIRGKKIGAREIQNSVFSGTTDQVQPVLEAGADYPADIDNYYIDYTELFRFRSVDLDGFVPLIRHLPPWRAFLGPKRYVDGGLQARDRSLFIKLNLLYVLFVGVLPILNALAFVLLVGAFILRSPAPLRF